MAELGHVASEEQTAGGVVVGDEDPHVSSFRPRAVGQPATRVHCRVRDARSAPPLRRAGTGGPNGLGPPLPGLERHSHLSNDGTKRAPIERLACVSRAGDRRARRVHADFSCGRSRDPGAVDLVVCGRGSGAPGEESAVATFVLVHGAMHGGWCWSDVHARLARAATPCSARR